MDSHECAAVTRRLTQIRMELNYPKLTHAQASALKRELSMLERMLSESGYRNAASLTT